MADEEAQLNACLNIVRRMPPSKVENTLAGLVQLAPDLQDELLNNVDQPLQEETDAATGKKFLKCDYNRDGDSYRSPWSNKYTPDPEDGEEAIFPPDKLRAMEIEANQVLDVYRRLYFEGGVSSAFYFETSEEDEEAFGAAWLLKKDVEETKSLKAGFWNSVHVFECNPAGKNAYTVGLTSAVMVSMNLKDDQIGAVDLSGTMTKRSEKKCTVSADKTLLAQMGSMMEDLELQIRNEIEGNYIQKTRQVVSGMRSEDASKAQAWEGIAEALKSRG